MKFYWNKFLQLKPQNAVNLYYFIFTVHSQTEKYVESDFYVPWWQVETYYDLVNKALDSQSRGPLFENIGWLQGQISLLSLQGQSVECQELLETWELNGKK